jgi:hypothetical protein
MLGASTLETLKFHLFGVFRREGFYTPPPEPDQVTQAAGGDEPHPYEKLSLISM